MTISPSEAVDLQMDIWNWSDKEHCYNFLAEICDYQPGEMIPTSLALAYSCDEILKEEEKGIPLTLLQSKYMLHMSLMIAVRVMERSDTYVLSNDAHQLIQAAKKSLPGDIKFDNVTLPSNNGIVFLEKPVEISEFGFLLDKEQVSDIYANAVSWYDMNGDYYIVLWSNPHKSTHLLSPFFIAPINNDFVLPNGITFKPEDLKSLTDWLIAFWTFTSQKVPALSIEKGFLSRATKKRAIKFAHTGDILTITLRRRESKHLDNAEEESNIQWSHRWITHGHWRNQPYPSLGIRKLIYINDFVKGPDHLPLIVKDRVYNVSR